ncbi:MAG: EF-hand domain-containing protein [Planctomycetaceae bacterium]|nr:EF-hand domain-containing protein [Planctomycetaceae bacterium]
MANSLMEKLDTNSDGSLNADEISNAEGDLAEKITGADSDEDGSVSLEELIADITKFEGGMRPNMPPPPPSEDDAEDMATNIIDELDTNKDGVLSLDEIMAGGEKAEKILDADSNGDGQVTEDELVEDITKMQQQMETENKISSLTDLALNTYASATNILESDDSLLSLAA